MEGTTATQMTYRRFGRADVEVSAIGLGGFHLGVPKDPEESIAMVRTAIDAGLTFMDNSWDYHAGESERRMGRALQDGYRERAFLMTKLDSRTRDGTMRQLEESLERLQTDYVDLLQLHEVIREGDTADALVVLDAYLELREQGLCRYIGFTGHKDPAYHRDLIEKALDRGLVFDSVQMPVNAFDASFRSFTEEVLPLCTEHGIAAIGMKPLGAGKLVGRTGLEAVDLLRWALSQPVSVVVTGCESLHDVHQAIGVASGFEPLSQRELKHMSEQAAPLAADGHFEEYKTTTVHDGTDKNPQWME